MSVVPIRQPSRPAADPLPAPATLADDVLWGALAIANYLGWKPRRVYHEADDVRRRHTGFPAFKVGSQIGCRKSDLIAWIEALKTPGPGDP